MFRILGLAAVLLVGAALGTWMNGVYLGARAANNLASSLVPVRLELALADSLIRREGVASAEAQRRLASAINLLNTVDVTEVGPNTTASATVSAARGELALADSLMRQGGQRTAEGVRHFAESLEALDQLSTSTVVAFDQIDALGRIPLILALFSLVGALLFTGRGRELLRSSGLSRLSFSGAAIDLASPAGGRRIEATFRSERSQLETRLWAEADRMKVRSLLQDVVEQAVLEGLPEAKRNASNPRATIYIPDPIFEGALTQLVNYVGRGENRITRGRTYNERYGIIGSTWRAGRSKYDTVDEADDSALIRDWGMTVGDVSKRPGRGAQSYMAVILTAEAGSEFVGVVYVDAMPPGLFDDGALVEPVETACSETGLTRALTRIFDEFVRTGPRIQIFDE